MLFLSFSLWTTCQQREQTHPGRALLKQGSWISRGLVFTRWRSTLSFSFPLHFILQVLIVTVTAGLCRSQSVIIDQQWLLLFKVRTPAPMEEAINNTLYEVNYWYTQLWAHTQGTPHQALCAHVCVCVWAVHSLIPFEANKTMQPLWCKWKDKQSKQGKTSKVQNVLRAGIQGGGLSFLQCVTTTYRCVFLLCCKCVWNKIASFFF